MADYVAYYRVSTRRQGRSGLGLDAQRDVITAFLTVNDRLVGEFTEVVSGNTEKRDELRRAMRLARSMDAQLLIAKLDRFSRKVSFIASIMESGIKLTVAGMPHATDFQLHIFAALAQEERRLIAERTRLALQAAKKRGRVLGINGKVLAAANREAADEFAQRVSAWLPSGWQKMSFSALARHLNDEGHTTRNGGRFHPQTIKNLLMRRKIIDS
jgi:DNA invertase Pin-like site-specific DNA recombinase